MKTPAHKFVNWSPNISTKADYGASLLNMMPQHFLLVFYSTAYCESGNSNANAVSRSVSYSDVSVCILANYGVSY